MGNRPNFGEILFDVELAPERAKKLAQWFERRQHDKPFEEMDEAERAELIESAIDAAFA